MIKPMKVIFEMQPAPHLIIIEQMSMPLAKIKPLTAEMVRNILVQLTYLV